MATVAFGAALSHAGVKYLAASPETMLAPGVPSSVAHDIAEDRSDPAQLARDIVDTTMDTHYGDDVNSFGPAAAFDVIDLDPAKIARMEHGVKKLDAALSEAAHDRATRTAIRQDARAIEGMVRFPQGKELPWRADRPAIALYDTFAQDGRLDAKVRAAAAQARDAVADTVLAHRESDDFEPFNDADYTNAAGPTVHFPVNAKQLDPWAPEVSETDNAFYKKVGAADLARVVA